MPAPAPTDLEVARLLGSIRRRIVRLVGRRGIELECPGVETDATDERLFDWPLYGEIQGAAVPGRVVTGPRAGAVGTRGGLQAHLDGFDLHAAVAVPAGDRVRLELYRLRIADCGLRAVCHVDRVRITRAEVPRAMTKDELKRRTRRFALDVIHLVESLPRTRTAEVIGRQLPRSATSVGANYRAACRARSSADFVSKMGIVEEEADESMYWMELLVESGGTTADAVAALRQEANELLAITVSSIKTARTKRDRTR